MAGYVNHHSHGGGHGNHQHAQTQHQNLQNGPTLSIVLDAANICWAFVHSQPGYANKEVGEGIRPPVTGIIRCIEFWRQYGVAPVSIAPSWWKHAQRQGIWGNDDFEIQDSNDLMRLVDSGYLFFTPSQEHDDVYVIDFAYRSNGFVVSNDKFRDHVNMRNLSMEFIQERRIGFMFIRNLFLPNPDDIKRLEAFCVANNVVIHSPDPQPFIPPPPAAVHNHSHHHHHHHHHHSAQKLNVSSGQEYRRISVPDDAVKHIIGKKGSKVNEIRALPGVATISVEKDPTIVVIKGTPEGLQAAEEMVNEMVQVAERSRAKENQEVVKHAKPDTGVEYEPGMGTITLAKPDPGVEFRGDNKRHSIDMEMEDL